jgi:hypothetical protein
MGPGMAIPTAMESAETVPAAGYSLREMIRRVFAEVFEGNSHPSLRSRMDKTEGKLSDAIDKVADLEKCIDEEIRKDIGTMKTDLLTISRISKYLLAPLMLAITTGIGALLWAILTHAIIITTP